MSVSSLPNLKYHVYSCLKVSDEHWTRFELGYYVPEYDIKEKKRKLVDKDDLEHMIKLYEGKKEVLLWCYDPDVQVTGKKGERMWLPHPLTTAP